MAQNGLSILSSRLKEIRNQKGFTQSFVSARLNIETGTLSGYERGYRKPNTDMLVVLAGFYGVTTDWLLGKVDKPDLVCIDNLPGDPLAPTTHSDPCLSEITENLKSMTPEEREAIRRLTQSIANRQAKDVG